MAGPVPRAALVCALALGVLTACSAEIDAEGNDYAGNYSRHQPLAVVGYPSTGSLGITQEVVWRIADGDVDGLASLVSDKQGEDIPEKTAENWVNAFRKGAGGSVTAEFYDEGSYRQTVVLYLHNTGQIKELYVRAVLVDHEEAWLVRMAEADPAEATAVEPWIPKTPGELDSRFPDERPPEDGPRRTRRAGVRAGMRRPHRVRLRRGGAAVRDRLRGPRTAGRGRVSHLRFPADHPAAGLAARRRQGRGGGGARRRARRREGDVERTARNWISPSTRGPRGR